MKIRRSSSISGFLVTFLLIAAASSIDVKEGQNIHLKCRYPVEFAAKPTTIYWLQQNREGHDNAAIGDTAFKKDYEVENRPQEGIYDLMIKSATYDRDNGRFECHVKDADSGNDLHVEAVDVTVLLRPSPPSVRPKNPTATEGRLLNLTCASIGGSPPPEIQWFRNNRLLESQLIEGRTKDEPTTAVLTINPTKEDDNNEYKCTVRNRAMNEGEKMKGKTRIFVNYFPRVQVGPENPLKVEKDDTAQLQCKVDSKPKVNSVKWFRNGRFIENHMKHTIPRVSLEDAGSYVCQADNGLGEPGSKELILDVLHAPIVTLPESREVKEGSPVEIECQVAANPRPSAIKWFKEGDDKFLQNGPTLKLHRVTSAMNGKYTCSATNAVQPTGKPKTFRTGNATIAINIRHRPGQAVITPEKPVAIFGKSITLKCAADPPGFPAPTYRWWKEGSSSKNLASGSEFTIDSANLNSAGRYFCQPINELGTGQEGKVYMDVYQAPKIITQLQGTVIKRERDTGFHISCSAQGKPKPEVKWLKDGVEIIDGDSGFYEIANSEQEAHPNMGYSVLSTLKFKGDDRIGSNILEATDRGHYTCQFENEVDKAQTVMMLKVEHTPMVVHSYNRVAFDIGEEAVIPCRMQAYPAPRFEWSFNNIVLQNDGLDYKMNLTKLNDDIYEHTLIIKRARKSDYGDYNCKAMNSMGNKRTVIRLQKKTKPEKPTNVRAVHASYDFITLAWDEGFNGGFNSLFTVEYGEKDEKVPHYESCHNNSPCNITGLAQHTAYYVKVKASNIRGESKFSDEATVFTAVDANLIPAADNVHYATKNKEVSFSVSQGNDLPLVAKIELENKDGSWSHYDEVALAGATFGSYPVESEEPVNNLRVRFCVESPNDLHCGAYKGAEIVEVSPISQAGLATEPWLIAVIILVVVVAIMIVVIVIKCCCCRRPRKTAASKNNRPDIVHTTQPPPYNTASTYGIENKGVDTVKDGQQPENFKNNIYTVQNGYYPGEQQSNSNSNSANGGSVNSQDSLWNVKGNAMGVPGVTQQHPAMAVYNPGEYGYDPVQQQGYIQQQQQQQQPQSPQLQQQEDYAHYPYPDEYLNERNQQYLMQDHYGMVQQQQPNNDYSAYGDVSGMPDPYVNQHHGMQQQQQHQQGQDMGATPTAHFEEAQDDEFSPNRNNRRIIREIIV